MNKISDYLTDEQHRALVSAYDQFRRQTGDNPDTVMLPLNEKTMVLATIMSCNVVYAPTDRILFYKVKK